MLGGAIGWSDLESGAVTASHATAAKNSASTPAIAQRASRQRLRGLAGAGRGAAPTGGSRGASYQAVSRSVSPDSENGLRIELCY